MALFSILDSTKWRVIDGGVRMVSDNGAIILHIDDDLNLVKVYFNAHDNFFYPVTEFDYYPPQSVLDAGEKELPRVKKFIGNTVVRLNKEGKDPYFKCDSCNKIEWSCRDAYDHFVEKHRHD